MNKNIALISSCLLVFSTQSLANRPAMSGLEDVDMSDEPSALSLEVEMPANSATAVSEPDTDNDTMDNRAMDNRPSASTPTPMPEEDPANMENDARPAAMETETLPAEKPAMKKANEGSKPVTKTTTTKSGDVLELKPGDTLPVHTLDYPKRGTLMDNVRKELGEPITATPPVGDPPITIWTYKDRTVYFEFSRVIHTVANQQ